MFQERTVLSSRTARYREFCAFRPDGVRIPKLSDLLKRLASKFPMRTQQVLKRLHFGRQIRLGSFASAEPEYAKLSGWIARGDWAIDIGANVGHYTARLSQLVGKTGRVLAFEPVPHTFELLVSNIAVLGANNVSLFNVAVSSEASSVGMSIPQFDTGLANNYEAGITSQGGQFDVLTIALDSLRLPHRVSLIKIDIEGHELQALRGMQELLRRDHPRLIIEGRSEAVLAFLQALDYKFDAIPQSPNRVFFKA